MSMSDPEFEAALRRIVATSDTADEVRRRARTELGHSYFIDISSRQPTTEVEHEAAVIVANLGGCQLRTGAMAMVMTWSPSGSGNIVQL